MTDLVELLTVQGQEIYYTRPLKAALKNVIYSYLVELIVDYAVDINAFKLNCVHTLNGHEAGVMCCSALPNGNLISTS